MARGYGVADVDHKVPCTPQTLFRIASIAKGITALATLRACDEQLLNLDDAVFGNKGILSCYCTSDEGKGGNEDNNFLSLITVRHLLTHTSGGWPNRPVCPMFTHPTLNHHELIHTTLRETPGTFPPLQAPGTVCMYSNFGYCLLGRVLEKRTGLSYLDTVRKFVCDPIGGIEHMYLAADTPEGRYPLEASYYNDPTSPYDPVVSRMDANGGLVSTPTEMVRIGLGLKSLLSKEAYQELTRVDPVVRSELGGGWFCRGDGAQLWTCGSMAGTQSTLVVS
eukprot:PhF_6_TR3697/c0_g1_i3/m.5268